MQTSIRGKTAGGILKTAKVVKMRAGTWEVVVSHPHQCIAMTGERRSGWGGTIADVMVLTDATGLVARLEMSATAMRKLAALERDCEAKYSAQ
jgi:hypothetical protein